jgi:hypothetical protein
MIFFYFLFALAVVLLGVATWNALAWPRIAGGESQTGARRVAILIPARNEADNLAACLDAALAQGEIVKEILVYDDHSTDETPAIIKEYATREARVRLVSSAPLPADWCGKTFACAQLAEAARGEWLLFLDADARLDVGAAARMLREAERRRLTLLSCWPALELVGCWEKTLMPLLNFVVFTLYPAPLALRRPDASLGLAHGACLLAHRATYALVGGHGAVRDQLFEDVRLAQLWRDARAGEFVSGRAGHRQRSHVSLVRRNLARVSKKLLPGLSPRAKFLDVHRAAPVVVSAAVRLRAVGVEINRQPGLDCDCFVRARDARGVGVAFPASVVVCVAASVERSDFARTRSFVVVEMPQRAGRGMERASLQSGGRSLTG